MKKVFEFANEEAAVLNHNYVGTEHLLLALLRQADGVAAQVLENLNLLQILQMLILMVIYGIITEVLLFKQQIMILESQLLWKEETHKILQS